MTSSRLRTSTPAAVLCVLCGTSALRAAAAVDMGMGRESAYTLWKAGVRAVLKGEPKMAGALWERCLREDPANEDCRAGLVLMGRDLADKAPAETYSPPREDALREGAKVRIDGRKDALGARKNFELGLRYDQQGQFRQAHDAWTRCLELDPGNEDCAEGVARLTPKLRAEEPRRTVGAAAAHYRQGLDHFMRGAHDKARASWEACLQADPSFKDCREGLRRLR